MVLLDVFGRLLLQMHARFATSLLCRISAKRSSTALAKAGSPTGWPIGSLEEMRAAAFAIFRWQLEDELSELADSGKRLPQ